MPTYSHIVSEIKRHNILVFVPDSPSTPFPISDFHISITDMVTGIPTGVFKAPTVSSLKGGIYS